MLIVGYKNNKKKDYHLFGSLIFYSYICIVNQLNIIVMAIYSEEQDPNEKVKTTKEITIDKINEIIREYGSFTTAEVEASHSPMLEAKGKLTHLAEEFMDGTCVVNVYDPTSHSCDEIDSYDEFYNAFDEDQLEYILELAEKWVEINSEED